MSTKTRIDERLVAGLLIAMIVWSVFAVGGVYPWAGVPLMLVAALVAFIARTWPGASQETRTLDRLLLAAVAAAMIQLVPIPPVVRELLSPNARAVRDAVELRPVTSAWLPLSVSPASTAYSIGLVLTALVVFWAARRYCARGPRPSIIRNVAFAGLVAAIVAIALQAGDPTLIYGLWPPLDAGARPFGPFVNRHHFATWVLMACPLAMGYVAASFGARTKFPGVETRILEWSDTSAMWGAVAALVMMLALAISTSGSGLVAFAASAAAAALLARGRWTYRIGVWSLVAVLASGAVVGASVNTQSLRSRAEETQVAAAGGPRHIWQDTLRIVRDFPAAGVGLGAYRTAMLVYQQSDQEVLVNQAHNHYLQLLAEGGLLVSVPAVLTAAAFVRLFRQRLAQDTSPSIWMRIGAATAMVAVAVQSLFETGLRIPANGLLFALAAAVAVHRPLITAPDVAASPRSRSTGRRYDGASRTRRSPRALGPRAEA
jgi:O-antigen ligase